MKDPAARCRPGLFVGANRASGSRVRGGRTAELHRGVRGGGRSPLLGTRTGSRACLAARSLGSEWAKSRSPLENYACVSRTGERETEFLMRDVGWADASGAETAAGIHFA